MKKIPKEEAQKKIREFFREIKSKNAREVKRIKKFAMRHSVKLGDFRKKFCKECFSPYKNPKVRVKKDVKIIECKNCGAVSRWKISSS